MQLFNSVEVINKHQRTVGAVLAMNEPRYLFVLMSTEVKQALKWSPISIE